MKQSWYRELRRLDKVWAQSQERSRRIRETLTKPYPSPEVKLPFQRIIFLTAEKFERWVEQQIRGMFMWSDNHDEIRGGIPQNLAGCVLVEDWRAKPYPKLDFTKSALILCKANNLKAEISDEKQFGFWPMMTADGIKYIGNTHITRDSGE